MNHADVKSLLADYLEGDLSLDKRARVDGHLDACRECAEEVEQIQQTIRLLRMLPEPETPPMITANVMRRIRAGETRPGLLARLARALDPGFVLPAAAVAAASLVFVVVQDPSSFAWRTVEVPQRQTDMTQQGAQRGAASTLARDTERTAPDAQRAGLEPDPGRYFGAPAARSFRTLGDGLLGSGLQGSSGANRAGPIQTRIRIELEPSGQPGTILFQDPLLASTLSAPLDAPLDMSPSVGWLRTRRGSERWATQRLGGVALPVAQPRQGLAGQPDGLGLGSSGGEDKRDEWIARGLEDPAAFARYLASQNLAEQELWITRLSERARSQGVLEQLVHRLRESGDTVASLLAADFAAESARLSGALDGESTAR